MAKKLIKKLSKIGNNIKSYILEEEITHFSPLEETGIILYINGAVLSIIASILVVISYMIPGLTINYGKYFIYAKILPLIWILLAVAALYFAEKYVRSRKSSDIKYLFYVAALSLASASGFLITGILMSIGTYFIYEAHLHNE